MNKNRRILWVAVISLLGIAAIFFLWKPFSGGEKGIPVDTVKIMRGDINENVSGSGQFYPKDEELVPVQAGLKVFTSNVVENSRIEKGKVLAVLDNGELSYLLKKAIINDAQLRADLVELKDGENTYLIESKERQIQANRVDIDNLKKKISMYTIKAPISGTILSEDLKVGSTVRAGYNVVIKNLDRLEFHTFLVQEDGLLTAVGQEAALTVEGSGSEFPGKVSFISPVAIVDTASGSRTPKIEVIIDAAGEWTGIGAGFSGDVRIITKQLKGVLLTERENVRFNEDGSGYVYRVQDGKAKKTEVKLGTKDEKMVEIQEGLGFNETIINNPSVDLKDGIGVTVTER